MRGSGSGVPVDLELFARLLRLPPCVGDDGNTSFHAWFPGDVRSRRNAAVDDQDVAYAGERLDRIDVCGFHFAGKDGRPFNAGVEHAGQFDIDGEQRLAGDEGVRVDAGLGVADDGVVFGVFELYAAQRGRRQCCGLRGNFAIAD